MRDKTTNDFDEENFKLSLYEWSQLEDSSECRVSERLGEREWKSSQLSHFTADLYCELSVRFVNALRNATSCGACAGCISHWATRQLISHSWVSWAYKRTTTPIPLPLPLSLLGPAVMGHKMSWPINSDTPQKIEKRIAQKAKPGRVLQFRRWGLYALGEYPVERLKVLSRVQIH